MGSTLIVCSVGEEENTLFVFCFSVLEVANVVGAIGVDGSALAVRHALEPVALVVSFSALDVVVVDAGEFLFQLQHFYSV